MPRLFIRFAAPAIRLEEGFDVRASWLIEEDGGSVRANGEADFRGLSDLIDPGTDWVGQPQNIIVIVPSDDVLSVSCEVPGRSIGQIRRALPYVVEEFVTTDIERMHLASGPLRAGAPTRSNLIDRELLEGWLDCLKALQIKPGYVVSEAELLPTTEGQVTLVLSDAEALLRTPEQSASVDRDNLVLALAAIEPKTVCEAYGALSDMERGQLDSSIEITRLDLDGEPPESRLEFLARCWRLQSQPINLLQGAYQVRQPVSPHWARWRPVAALVAVLVGLELVLMISQGLYASYRADQLEAASEALYREIFPQDRRVTNVRRQMQARLGESAGGSEGQFVDQVGALAGSLAATATVLSINYTDERGELAVDVLLRGYEELDHLKEALAARGISVDITSAEKQEQGVRARVRIRDAGQGT
ncbi:MAG: type II secretion system protein GspL [Pseudomonadales bacterium]